jgi:hypothetical protein
MGGMSLGLIQKEFAKRDSQENAEFWGSNSRRFYKNAKGAAVKDKSLINKIEGILGGTKRLLHLPLWLILEEPDADLSRLQEMMRQLPPYFQNLLLKVDTKSGLLIRKKISNKWQVSRLSMQNDLDALACLLMLTRESELLKRIDLYIELKWQVNCLVSRLVTFPPFESVAQPIYDLIFEHFIKKNDPLPTEMKNIWVETYFDKYQSPKQLILFAEKDSNLGMLWHAEQRGLVSSKKENQLQFLFWALSITNRTLLDNELKGYSTEKKPFNNHDLPPELSMVMAAMNGDIRKNFYSRAFHD